MPVDTQQILDMAQKLGQLLKDHPAVEKFKQAQKAVAEDAEAGRLMAEFDRQLETLARQEQSGRPMTDAQRLQLEAVQAKLASHLKVKNLHMSQVEFMDLLRKVSQTYQQPLAEAAGTAARAKRGPVA